jgi:outer membrane protein OmpA-like peptidoglycan-associated protein
MEPEGQPVNSESKISDQQNKEQKTEISTTGNTETVREIQIAPPLASRIEPLPLMKEKVIIQFDINSNEIEDGSYAALDRIAHYLTAYPDQKIIVRGYTDSSWSPGYNETVSNFRANAVKSYLIGKGVQAGSLEVYAMGAFNPIASNETLAGRRKNRRVEIEYVESQMSGNW